jgi:benzil reductase ((S)-benzoin forming)
MQLTAAFLGATDTWAVPRKVLNISSGLGRRAMASQAAYCAAKAGMDHFTRCVALDEAVKPHGAKVCSLAPGVIDTDMQVQLRGADPAAFPDRQNFANLKTGGQLSSPPRPLPACSPGWSAQTSAPTRSPTCAMPDSYFS